MDREKLLEEVWKGYVKNKIMTCVVMKEKKRWRASCVLCDFYPICRKVFDKIEGRSNGQHL